MTESVYDGAQTAADILCGYHSYLRAKNHYTKHDWQHMR